MLLLVLFKVMSTSSGRDWPGAAAAHRFVYTQIFPRNHVPISLTLKAILLSLSLLQQEALATGAGHFVHHLCLLLW